jgi:hypothetical protein
MRKKGKIKQNDFDMLLRSWTYLFFSEMKTSVPHTTSLPPSPKL